MADITAEQEATFVADDLTTDVRCGIRDGMYPYATKCLDRLREVLEETDNERARRYLREKISECEAMLDCAAYHGKMAQEADNANSK